MFTWFDSVVDSDIKSGTVTLMNVTIHATFKDGICQSLLLLFCILRNTLFDPSITAS